MIKNIFLAALVLFVFSCKQAAPAEPDNYTEMPWVSIDKVEDLVEKKSKKILVDVYTPWCGPCKMMDRNTFTDPEVMNIVGKNFYPVKFNAEGPDVYKFKGKEYSNPGFDPAKAKRRNGKHQLANFFAVRGYPTLVVMDENMQIIEKITGYKTPEQLIPLLEKYKS